MAEDVFSDPPKHQRSWSRGLLLALAWSSGLGCGGAASAPGASEPMPDAPPPPPAPSQPPEEAVEPTPSPVDSAPAIPLPTDEFEQGRCNSNADCGTDIRVRCSLTLNLCYETMYGYVWDPSTNGGQGAWSTPPSNVAGCGPDLVYWPLINSCYDPLSGYAWNPTTNVWSYVGDWYTAGPDDGIEPGPPPTDAP